MNKLCILLLCFGTISYTSSKYTGATLAPVILAGSVVKHTGTEITKKYNRKDCPICKGTGKYLSGDSISWVECGYCEPTTKDVASLSSYENKKVCTNKNCVCKNCKCNKCGCLPSVK